MRLAIAILLGLYWLPLLASQAIDPNKTGLPHDTIWFNEPKNPQPGVTHHGYHSASMNKDVGYNIWLPPEYETSSRRYPTGCTDATTLRAPINTWRTFWPTVSQTGRCRR